MTDQVPTPPSPKGTRRFALAALAVAVAALLAITVGGIGENLVYYWGPADIEKAGDRAIGATIRLGGQVAPDSIELGKGVSQLEFDVIGDGGRVHVRADGVPPQMFREGVGVVVEGTMSKAGYFEGHRLLVSHDNEYRAPEAGEKVDARRQMGTVRESEEAPSRP